MWCFADKGISTALIKEVYEKAKVTNGAKNYLDIFFEEFISRRQEHLNT